MCDRKHLTLRGKCLLWDLSIICEAHKDDFIKCSTGHFQMGHKLIPEQVSIDFDRHHYLLQYQTYCALQFLFSFKYFSSLEGRVTFVKDR